MNELEFSDQLQRMGKAERRFVIAQSQRCLDGYIFYLDFSCWTLFRVMRYRLRSEPETAASESWILLSFGVLHK